MRVRMKLVIAAVAAVVGLTSAGVAVAVFPDDNVSSYAGCLNTNASPGGTFVNVAVGDKPSKACGSGQVLVHLSGGDITAVDAGPGLSGGSTNGAASVSVDPKYQLPQGCTNDSLPKWVTSTSTWRCAADDNAGGTITGVTAGTGLTGGGTSGAVSLALGNGYQLPQSCGNGQVAKSNGSNGWSCQDDDNSGGDAYYATDAVLPHGILSDGVYHIIAFKSLPAGSYTLIARTTWTDQDHYAHLVCAIRAFDNVITSGSDIVEEHTQDVAFNDEGKYESSITLVGVTTLAVPATVDMACRTVDPGIDVFQTALLATRVGAIH